MRDITYLRPPLYTYHCWWRKQHLVERCSIFFGLLTAGPRAGCSSEGVKKSSEDMRNISCGTYPVWPPNKVRAYSSAGVKKPSAGVSITEVYATTGDTLSICTDLIGGENNLVRFLKISVCEMIAYAEYVLKLKVYRLIFKSIKNYLNSVLLRCATGRGLGRGFAKFFPPAPG